MGQINFGVEKVTTKWFSVLEYDDEYAKDMKCGVL